MPRRSSPSVVRDQKRHVAATSEPANAPREAASGRRFVVQKHDARQLHFDLRLELDGVMKCWAVTHGPSLDPDDKRLAVRTEDQRITSQDFEGPISRGHAGGMVMLWDYGYWQPRGDPHDDLDRGILKFDLEGERLKGGFALVRLGKKARESRENWLLVKERDAHAKRDGHVADPWLGGIVTGRVMHALAAGRAGRRPLGKRRGRRTARRGASKLLDADNDSDPLRMSAEMWSTLTTEGCR